MSGSLLEVRKKIAGVQNTSKITKAMQLVAASKMRQFQKKAVSSRQYTWDMLQIMEKLLRIQDEKIEDKSIFTKKRETGKTLFVLYTSDKGLCGPLNNKLINGLFRSKKWNSLAEDERLLITIGKKSFSYAQSNKIPVAKSFIGIPEKITTFDMIKIIDSILNFWRFGADYHDENVAEEETEEIEQLEADIENTEENESTIKEIYFVAPYYKNSFTFYPTIKKFLPLDKETVITNIKVSEEIEPEKSNDEDEEYNEETEDMGYMLYSPDKQRVIRKLHENIIQNMFVQAFLELKASEYSSRMIAMQNATDSANRIINELRLSYNKARQQAITQEIAELIGASMAISETE